MENTTITFRIPANLKNKFIAMTKQNNSNSQQILITLVEEWTKGHIVVTKKFKAPQEVEQVANF